jgi:acyl carrier protein
MSDQAEEIRARIRERLTKLLPADTPVDTVEDDTPLVTAGLLDSVAALKLVDHLEESYDIEFEPEELSAEYLDTVTQIVALVLKKLEAA